MRPAENDGAYNGNSDGEGRSPLHEAFTVVFIQFSSVLRLLGMGAVAVAGACIFGYLHTTVVLRLHAWYRHRREQHANEQRGESSDEEVVTVDEQVVVGGRAQALEHEAATTTTATSSSRRQRVSQRNADDDDELQPLTAAVSRESTPPNSPPPGMMESTAVTYSEGTNPPSTESAPSGAPLNEADATPMLALVPGDGEATCLRCNAAINCVLLRCNHAVVCYPCSRSMKNCPRCGDGIHKRQRLFIV
jgi:hypothetical protein